jgi:hypothetical protein
MGPPPKPPEQRRNRAKPLANVLKLPAEGRKGPPPPWPFGEIDAQEQDMWERLWATPMAVAWERLNWVDQVARYVQVARATRRKKAPWAAYAEARQMEDRLGLNPLALVRLRWEISADELAEARADRKQPARRLKAVDPGAKVARPKRTG